VDATILNTMYSMYVGCVAGALQKKTYLETMRRAGFTEINIHMEKQVMLPDEILLNYMSGPELSDYRAGKQGIFSITVTGRKN